MFLECQLDGFRSLQKSEKEILKSVVEVLDIGKKSDIGIVGAQKHMLDNVHLSGSITEGSGMAALFKPSTNGKGKINNGYITSRKIPLVVHTFFIGNSIFHLSSELLTKSWKRNLKFA